MTKEELDEQTLALLLLSGSLVAPPVHAVPSVDGTGTTTSPAISLRNSTAVSVIEGLPTPDEYELDSPNFVPASLAEFAAAGFVRKNRWS